MADLIVKNYGGSDVGIDDLGISVPASGEIDLDSLFTRAEITGSSDLKALVLAGMLTVNDGIKDLTVEEGYWHVRHETEWEDLSELQAHEVTGKGFFEKAEAAEQSTTELTWQDALDVNFQPQIAEDGTYRFSWFFEFTLETSAEFRLWDVDAAEAVHHLTMPSGSAQTGWRPDSGFKYYHLTAFESRRIKLQYKSNKNGKYAKVRAIRFEFFRTPEYSTTTTTTSSTTSTTV